MGAWKKWIVGEWNWMRPIKSLAFIYLCLLVVACGFSNRILFQPPQARYTEQMTGIQLIERSEGKQVAVYHHPAKPDKPTLLWSHGNAEDIGYLQERLSDFRARGYGILAYDYPGYGLSEGSPNEDSCQDACRAAWQHLTDDLGVRREQVIIYGQSVGSGPSVWLAEQEPCAGLMLVSPFVSAFRAVTRVPLFPGDRFKNIQRIEHIRTPLLVVHGDRDQVIKPWHGKKLHELHPGPKTFVEIEGVGHNDLYLLATDEVLGALDQFWKDVKTP
ncbi:alpha/beta hydrolase [Verrucomicrobiaceae bacterium R5-34]|uniref:Alpha/beta hydrolase n=1 Tax=Oceaniferula flava TaxID=2800421 RepID=A0AAE2SDM7_9BACT|nr:alpha/beta hydrolase [Oceaniferula flavus]MBK1829852.1 alpha/beta hydrolase [Verrucomicrobiaceae bacterium R5-34]MBK1856321.1 alpha/beta hydrolase [Oceaniferula flavus]MBM1137628.1 alpha/beta hydrolase [Oceaniferula flavus]